MIIISLLLAARAVTETVCLPVCDKCRSDRLGVRRLRWGLGVTMVGAFAGTTTVTADWTALLSMLLGVAWVLSLTTLVHPLYAVSGFVANESFVELRKVHPAFVAALHPNPAWTQGPVAQRAPGLWGSADGVPSHG